MKNNATNIVAGILIQNEMQNRNDEIAREQQHENDRLNDPRNILQKQNQSFAKQSNKLKVGNKDLEYDLEVLQNEFRAVYEKAAELQTEVDRFKLLLCEPMEEIAKINSNFAQTYEQQMDLLAAWMLSQKAFKEVAIKLGAEKGLSADDVIRLGSKEKLAVLDNKHNPEHGSNASDIPLLEEKADALREQITAQLNATETPK